MSIRNREITHLRQIDQLIAWESRLGSSRPLQGTCVAIFKGDAFARGSIAKESNVKLCVEGHDRQIPNEFHQPDEGFPYSDTLDINHFLREPCYLGDALWNSAAWPYERVIREMTVGTQCGPNGSDLDDFVRLGAEAGSFEIKDNELGRE